MSKPPTYREFYARYLEPDELARNPLAANTPAVLEIIQERRRLLVEERVGTERDDSFGIGQLHLAAAIYYRHAVGEPQPTDDDGVPQSWPLSRDEWQPLNRRQSLVRAGTLCLSERDRLARVDQGMLRDGVKLTHWVPSENTPAAWAVWWPPHVKDIFDKIVTALDNT